MLDFPRAYCKPFAYFAESRRGDTGGSARSAPKEAPLSAEAQWALLFVPLSANRSAQPKAPRLYKETRGNDCARRETQSQISAEKGRERRMQRRGRAESARAAFAADAAEKKAPRHFKRARSGRAREGIAHPARGGTQKALLFFQQSFSFIPRNSPCTTRRSGRGLRRWGSRA